MCCLQPVIRLAVVGRHSAEPYAELRVAAAEQMKITELRLAKLLPAPAPSQPSGRPSPPLGAGGVQRHSTAGSASGAAAGQLEEADQAAAAAAPGSTAAAAQAAERRSGRLRAHFLPRGGDSPSAVVPSPTAAPPGVCAIPSSPERDRASQQQPTPVFWLWQCCMRIMSKTPSVPCAAYASFADPALQQRLWPWVVM